MIKIDTAKSRRIQQGDIFRNIEFVQRVEETNEEVIVHKLLFPLSIVLTQDCDLEQDSEYYLSTEEKPKDDDKKLLSVIMAPIYNEELFLLGDHLNDETIHRKMQAINKGKPGKLSTQYRNLIHNEIPRYHYLDFPEGIPIVNSIIDFKHYFAIDVEELLRMKEEKYLCKISELYREHISHRFAYFLSRVGLPNK